MLGGVKSSEQPTNPCRAQQKTPIAGNRRPVYQKVLMCNRKCEYEVSVDFMSCLKARLREKASKLLSHKSVH